MDATPFLLLGYNQSVFSWTLIGKYARRLSPSSCSGYTFDSFCSGHFFTLVTVVTLLTPVSVVVIKLLTLVAVATLLRFSHLTVESSGSVDPSSINNPFADHISKK